MKIERWAWRAIAAVLLALFGWMIYQVLGLATVTDRSGEVVSARLVDGAGHTQPLFALPWGRFATIVRLEGVIEVQCRDGSKRKFGYVARLMNTAIEIPEGGNCADARDA